MIVNFLSVAIFPNTSKFAKNASLPVVFKLSFFSSPLSVWKSAQARSSCLTCYANNSKIVHLTSEEADRAESGNLLLVNPSDDAHSKKNRIEVCVIAAET